MRYIHNALKYLLFWALPLTLSAQNEGNNWFFGNNAGVTFNGGSPVSINGGQINTVEGCSAISDTQGNLLFYSDGITVWNKEHNPMPNGFGLAGDPSSTQSGVIMSKPGAPGRYFIFTTMSTFAFSEVDMSLNGGLGDVVTQTKNTYIPPSSGTEKLTAVKHASENAYWVVTHEMQSNAFYAYKVDANGVNMTPVVSNVGSVVDWGSTIGSIKISPDGKKLGMVMHSAGTAELFDFNNTTGVVSNAIHLDGFTGYPYGTEFSPDGSKWYISTEVGPEVFQYDISSNNATIIPQTKYKVVNTGDQEVGALQLGPDSKVYISRYGKPYLGVIKNPNGLGAACNYLQDGVSLNGHTCQLGLPNFLGSFFSTCSGSNLRFLSLFKKAYVCPDCSDGKIIAAGIGGAKPYTYSIDGVNFQNSGVFNNLSPGMYVVTIRDANGCQIKRIVKL